MVKFDGVWSIESSHHHERDSVKWEIPIDGLMTILQPVYNLYTSFHDGMYRFRSGKNTKLDAHPRIRSIKKPCNLRCLSNRCICPKHWGKKNLQTGMLLLDRFFQVSLSIAISRSLVCPDRQNDHIADIVQCWHLRQYGPADGRFFCHMAMNQNPGTIWYHLVPSGTLKSPGNGCFFPQNPPNMVYLSMYFMCFD